MLTHDFYARMHTQQAIAIKCAIAQQAIAKHEQRFNDAYRKIEQLEKHGYTIVQIPYHLNTRTTDTRTTATDTDTEQHKQTIAKTLPTYSTTHTDLHTVYNKTISMFDSELSLIQHEKKTLDTAKIEQLEKLEKYPKINVSTVTCKRTFENGKIRHYEYCAVPYIKNTKFNDFIDTLNCVKIVLSTVKTKHMKMSKSATVCKKLCIRLGVIGAVYMSMCNFVSLFGDTDIHTAKINEYVTHIFNRLKVDDRELCDMLTCAIIPYLKHTHSTKRKATTQQAIAINIAYTAVNKYMTDSAKISSNEIADVEKHVDDSKCTLACLYDVATAHTDLLKYDSDTQTDSDKKAYSDTQKSLLVNACIEYIDSLTIEKRDIFEMYVNGLTHREIADRVNKHHSTITRYIKAIKDSTQHIFALYGENYADRHSDTYIKNIMKNVVNATYSNMQTA